MRICKDIIKIGLCSALFVAAFYPLTAFAGPQGKNLPRAASMMLSKASALMEKKEFDKALDVLIAFQTQVDQAHIAGAADPKGRYHPEVCFAIGTCYLLKEDYRAAAKVYEKILKENPGHLSTQLNLAKASYELSDYGRAAQCFESAYAQTGHKNPEHLYHAAAAYLMANKSDLSIAAFELLFSRHSDAVQNVWRENFVHALLSNNCSRRALPVIKYLSEVYSGEKQVQWQEILLHQYMQLDMRKEALDYATFLTRQDPTRGKWWKALTHVQLQDGQYRSALTAMTIYSFLSPLSDTETKLLADLNLQLGIPVKAVPLYELSLNTRFDPQLLHHLMLALRELGQSEKAVRICERLAPDCEHIELMLLKADLLYSLEEYPNAEKVYIQAANMDTKKTRCGRAWLMAGYAALQANDLATSHSAFKKAAGFKRHREAALLAMRQMVKMEQRKQRDK